jgi:hypothetical protein
MKPEDVIAKIAAYCSDFAWMAGVGGVETAGAVVSYLAAHPEHTQVFLFGGVSALMDTCDDAREFFSQGCLTFHRQIDGKVTTPEELRAAIAARDAAEGVQP